MTLTELFILALCCFAIIVVFALTSKHEDEDDADEYEKQRVFVIRVPEEKLEETVAFFEDMMLEDFHKERHGNGPVHYSADDGFGNVLEIYPTTSTNNTSGFYK